jgi:hypothetical protein
MERDHKCFFILFETKLSFFHITIIQALLSHIGVAIFRKGYYYSPRLKMVTTSFRKHKIMQPMRRLSMDCGGPNIFLPGWRRVEGGVICSGGGALLSRQVCMSPSWPAKKILSKIGVNLHLNTLALLFWWFSFLILSHVLCLKLNCHIHNLKWCVTWKRRCFYFK